MTSKNMKHASLFSGIGGFDLAAQWMGWENIFQVEIDQFCQKVLEKNFPGVARYGDIKQFDGTQFRGAIDILTGGFPCQPYSTAGKRKGKEDDRHLWPEMLRVIREVQPGYVVGENVRGLTNWSRGLVFDEVQADLEAEGYEVLPFLLPACAVNAPHRRDRIWFIAYSAGNHDRRTERELHQENGGQIRKLLPKSSSTSKWASGKRVAPHTNSEIESTRANNGKPRCGELGPITTDTGLQRSTKSEEQTKRIEQYRSRWESFPTQPPICRRNDGVPCELHIIRRIENEIKSSDQEGKPAGNLAIWKAMRTMWEHREFAEASPELFVRKVCDSLSIVPCESGSIGWLQESEEAKELRGMWEVFYAKPYEEAQDLQSRMLERLREIERRKKMEQKQRVNRNHSLGNAIVPQVAFEIFKAIQEINGRF